MHRPEARGLAPDRASRQAGRPASRRCRCRASAGTRPAGSRAAAPRIVSAAGCALGAFLDDEIDDAGRGGRYRARRSGYGSFEGSRLTRSGALTGCGRKLPPNISKSGSPSGSPCRSAVADGTPGTQRASVAHHREGWRDGKQHEIAARRAGRRAPSTARKASPASTMAKPGGVIGRIADAPAPAAGDRLREHGRRAEQGDDVGERVHSGRSINRSWSPNYRVSCRDCLSSATTTKDTE